MYIHIFILSTLLFFVLSPNVLLNLLPNGSKYVVALLHAIIFGGFLAVILKYYNDSLLLQEGAKGRQNRKKTKKFFKKVDKGPIKTIRKSSFAKKLTKMVNCVGNNVAAIGKGGAGQKLSNIGKCVGNNVAAIGKGAVKDIASVAKGAVK